MKIMPYMAVAMMLLCVSSAIHASDNKVSNENPGYYRAPALHGEHIVFTAEGDLWKTSTSGGPAQRLTTHPADESYAAISPDGSQVAFVADYEGVPEAYVMPLMGGKPKRVSFENSRVRVQGWTASGAVLYSTDSAVGPANHWVLKTVDPDSLQVTDIPLADAIQGSMGSNDEMVFFARFGLQYTGDNTRIYRGGAMGELWSFRPGSDEEARLLTEQHIGSARQPMYWQEQLYFISDSDGTPNIWSMDTDGQNIQQVTEHTDWQVRSASIHGGRIAYQLGADIKLLDLATGESELLDIHLISDFSQRQERWLEEPLNYLTATHFSGDNERVTLTARSQIAIAGKAPRRLVQVSTPTGSRSRNAVLSHDGRWVYAINDHSGENEIWRFPADGSAEATQLTDNGSAFRWQLHLSPNGNYIAHDDKNGHLWLLNLSNGNNQRIASDGWGHRPYADISWSADSNLLAFTQSHKDGSRPQVILYSLADEQQQRITSGKYESFSPAFSPDGHWLYFLSNRNFNATPRSPWGDRNMGPFFDKRTQIFAVSLKSASCFPFEQPREVAHCDQEAAEESRSGRRAQLVDWDNIAQRLWQVPVSAHNFSALSVSNEHLYVMRRSATARSAQLRSIAIDAEKPDDKLFASDLQEYQLSRDAERIFLRTTDNQLVTVDAKAEAPSSLTDHTLDSAHWQLAFSPVEEWRQMFRDAWLMHRDFLFDNDMRGLDWAATRAKYEPLLQRLTDRHELDDLLAQMMGELNVLHSQVRGGDYPSAQEKPAAATLGATLEAEGNGVRITHMYRTDPELPEQASPLARPGVNAQVGDLITAVNGRPVSDLPTLNQLLRNQAGKQVRLDIRRGRSELQTVVEPVDVGRDHRLRYEDWVQHNREQVNQKSDNQFGYLHLYAMGANDMASFAREFYANIEQDGLIIDVRRNRGGNIDSWIIQRLLRQAWSFWEPNTHGAPYTNMQQAFRGHLIVLTDQLTYSDGETFSAGVKALQLGPLVGMRTTGAGVWLSGRNQLADGGLARVAETGQFAMDGRWVIEGYGVEPDVVVDNLPHATFNGYDAQLEKAIELLQRRLNNEPVPELRSQPVLAPVADDI
ncbi:peptidase S41 [Aliidiomarina minuta]|uniref:Tricorn protease homolog n=1 Tax=Aliidiomarina minuta TaxID=880057 RepID=A0A432W3L0_9GAMM|nr:S41 family peptidase [Aliidiomarina minuta]RUO23849.1 peptidase S41 [Aliidiomarina minuta]